MNAIRFGTMATDIDGSGFATVTFLDATRRCWFQPGRVAAPWPVPATGDRVAVCTGTPQWMFLAVIGAGAPTYSYSGG